MESKPKIRGLVKKAVIVAASYRKRGKSKTNTSEIMGDLDINLIKEYARRPGLYDRNSPYYKDKMYITQTWNEISQKLGFEIRLLKERMLQLRNRYNLEKRRIDAIRSKYPTRIVRSQWPLFMHMNFMSGHIKHRRSFSKMTTRQYRPMSMEACDTRSRSPPMTTIHQNGVTSSSNNSVTKNLNHSEIEVKCENHVEIEDDTMNLDQDNFLDDDIIDGAKDLPKGDYILRPQVTLSQPDIDGIRVRNSETVRPSVIIDDEPYTCERMTTHAYPSTSLYDAKDKKRTVRLQKYETFGKFLAISLCDMPEEKAMKLVEKFTSDMVKSFLSADDMPLVPSSSSSSLSSGIGTTSTTTTTANINSNTNGGCDGSGSTGTNNVTNMNAQSNSQNTQPIIQMVESVRKQQQQQHEEMMISDEKKNLNSNSTEAAVLVTDDNNMTAIPTTSNSISNNYDAEEYDEDQYIYDLTEDEPLSV